MLESRDEVGENARTVQVLKALAEGKAEMQAKLHKLEEQKTELENTDYVAVARSFKLTPQQLADFLKSQQAAPSETVLPQEKEDVHEA